MKKILDDVKFLNNGKPLHVGKTDGALFTVTPSTSKRGQGYYTEKPVSLTKYELKMPGVVVAQNRGMVFSSCRPVDGDYVIPDLKDVNIIIVDEKSRKLKPIGDNENEIVWVGEGKREVKDVVSDGTGVHYFVTSKGLLAVNMWLKIAKWGYGNKGMLMPGIMTDINKKVIDHWGVERTITLGNTILLNSSLIKGIAAYNSLEDFVKHSEQWGLTTLMKQWQSGDHEPENKRIMGTQPNSGNLQLTEEEISELLKPEARKIWSNKFEEIAWKKMANINSARGRAIAARPDLIYNQLIMNQIDNQAGNTFLRLAKGQAMMDGRYLKMFPDRLAYSLVYVDGMEPNEAATKAANTGLHGEIRVNPSYAGKRVERNEDGDVKVTYKKNTHLDNKGRYIEVALVRYPHGAPSETIIVKAYLDETVPDDVIMFPLPVANDDGTINVKYLYALRLQGADFDGDAVTAFSEKIWLEAQKRNIGKSYMIIPINTESTEKDKTLVTDETWEPFCEMKIASLSNKVGLIATSLKYLLAQAAPSIRSGANADMYKKLIADHSIAMGDDIDEFKHGKSNNELKTFVIPGEDGKDEILYSPYFNRYARKYKNEEDLDKVVFTKNGFEKKPGMGVLDMYAVETEKLMAKCKLPVVKEVTKASDGKNRYYYTVHPVKWNSKEVDLYAAKKGESQRAVALPEMLEKVYGVKPDTLFTSKDLFLMLYRNHAATCKMLMDGETYDENRDKYINALHKINERYALAKVTIVAWTKAMKKAKTGEEISTEEALKLFTTLMTQHTSVTRSTIDVLTRVGSFKKADGTEYEKTTFEALRVLNYFLDVCGDGIFLQKRETPNFPAVSDHIREVAGVTDPDFAKAKEKVAKEMELIEKIVSLIFEDRTENWEKKDEDELDKIVFEEINQNTESIQISYDNEIDLDCDF